MIFLYLAFYTLLKVPSTGFEPARREAPPPQDGESTNFSNWAILRQRYKISKARYAFIHSIFKFNK